MSATASRRRIANAVRWLLHKRRFPFVLAGCILQTALVVAAPAEVPYEFQAGDAIRASQLNANFDALAQAIDDEATSRIDGDHWKAEESTLRYDSNVGIGTQPRARLHIAGDNAEASIWLERAAETGAGPTLNLQKRRGTISSGAAAQSGDQSGSIWFNAYDGTEYVNNAAIFAHVDGGLTPGLVPGRLSFRTTTAGDELPSVKMTIKNDGKVGIGTETPSATLDVNGSIAVSGTVVHASDARLKRDVQLILNPLDKLTRLRGVTYNWKDTSRDPNRQMGLVAQDVERVAPEAVRLVGNTKSIAYAQLTGLTVEAIKELKAQNDLLAAELASLKAELRRRSDCRNRSTNDQ